MRNNLTKGEKALLLRMQDSFSLGKFKYVDSPVIGDTYLVFAADDGRVTRPEMKHLVMLIVKWYLKEGKRRHYVLTELGKQTIKQLQHETKNIV